MRVLVGIPTQWGLWRAEMGLSLYRVIANTQHALMVAPKNGPYLDENREACMRDAIQANADFLVFIDTDMVFPPDAVDRLLAHGKDVIGANYYEKRLPLVSTVKLFGTDGEMADDGKFVQQEMPPEPFRCAGLGAGLMAIRVSRVAALMAAPYFAFADRKGQRMGEELSFCERARHAGLEVWCDPTIPVLHVGEFPYGKLD